MPPIHLWAYPEDSVKFVDGLRRGESNKDRDAAADTDRVDVRPVHGREDEEEEIRRKEVKREDIKSCDGCQGTRKPG